MKTTIPKLGFRSSYETNFNLWLENTIDQLKSADFPQIDLANLIEELEAFGRSEKHEVVSRLRTLICHILKRCYVEMPECYRGWQVTIRTQRYDLEDRMTPTLKIYLEGRLDQILVRAIALVQEEYPLVTMPNQWQFSRDIDDLLAEIFWQE